MATRHDYASLDGRLSEVEQQLHIARQNILAIKRKPKEDTASVDRLLGEVAQMRQLLDEQGANPVLIGQITSLEGAVSELGLRVQMLEDGQQALSTDFHNHARATNEQLAELVVGFNGHDQELRSMSVRLDGASASAATANARLDEREDVPWWTVVTALVVGFFAGLLVNAKNFANSPLWAEQWWVPVVVGVLVAGFVFGLLLIVFGRHRSHAVSTSSASASTSSTPVPVASAAPKPVTAQSAKASASAPA